MSSLQRRSQELNQSQKKLGIDWRRSRRSRDGEYLYDAEETFGHRRRSLADRRQRLDSCGIAGTESRRTRTDDARRVSGVAIEVGMTCDGDLRGNNRSCQQKLAE